MIPDYLVKNKNRIQDKRPQYIPPWGKQYDYDIYKGFKEVKRLNEWFPNREIQRSDIIELYKDRDNWDLATTAALVWGYINATRNKDKTKTNYYRYLSYISNEGEQFKRNLDHLLELIKNQNFERAFQLYEAEYKIPGVGYAYFTKIFFFLGQAFNYIKVKPLILDKWTSNAYYALLASSNNQEKLNIYFRGISVPKRNSAVGSVFLRTGNILSKTYTEYVLDINEWAKELGLTSSLIEEFIFGESLKSNKNDDNPRIELWRIIKSKS